MKQNAIGWPKKIMRRKLVYNFDKMKAFTHIFTGVHLTIDATIRLTPANYFVEHEDPTFRVSVKSYAEEHQLGGPRLAMFL